MGRLGRIVSYSIVMCFLLCFMSYAETGWVQDGEDWYYENTRGERVRNEWKTSDSNKYYLGDDGKMVTNKDLEVDGEYYAVDENGVMIKDTWTETEDGWRYYSSSGKAYEEGWKTINNKKYHFTDYVMDTGFLSEDGAMLEDDSEAWTEAFFFVGDDGAQKQEAWVEIQDFSSDEYENYDTLWLWFGSNGRKAYGCEKRIGGLKYAFDENGALLYEWNGEDATSPSYKYYQNPSGQQENGGWFTAVPSEEQDADAHSNDTERKFWASKSGVVFKNGIKKIGGSRYIFDEYGIMRTGWIVIDKDNHIIELLSDGEDSDEVTMNDIRTAGKAGSIIYADETGKIKIGKTTLEIDGEKHICVFDNRGVAHHGTKDGYLYDSGILCKADKNDTDYKFAIFEVDGKKYLVNRSGKIQKEGTYKDDDKQWEVILDGDGSYIITESNYSKED